jgi:hypothetical protein
MLALPVPSLVVGVEADLLEAGEDMEVHVLYEN